MISVPPIPTRERAPLWVEALAALGLSALAVAFAHVAEPELDPQSLSLFFVAPVVISAIRFGLRASLATALLCTAAMNFFFVTPRYTFDIDRAQDAAALALLAITGAVVSALAAQARSDANAARLRAWEAVVLRDFAQQLSASADDATIAAAATATLASITQAPAALVAADGRAWGAALDAPARDAAKWSMSTKQPYAPSAEAAVDTPWSFWPILIAGQASFAVGARCAASVTPELGVAAGQIAAQSGVAFERARIEEQAVQARRDADREKLKGELLAGVSHDLRTPLATIVFTLQSLQRFAVEHAPETRAELIDLAEKEARRLAALVDSLLDAARLEAGASPVRIETVSVAALVERALAQADIGTAKVDVDIAPDLPLVRADPALAARALANVLENAARHGGAGIHLSADAAADMVTLNIVDRGPGLGPDPERLFEKFVRGAAGDGRAPGLGLGLPIARSLIESQGGALTARNRETGGALFRLALRAADG